MKKDIHQLYREALRREDYEKAARIRDRIRELESSTEED